MPGWHQVPSRHSVPPWHVVPCGFHPTRSRDLRVFTPILLSPPGCLETYPTIFDRCRIRIDIGFGGLVVTVGLQLFEQHTAGDRNSNPIGEATAAWHLVLPRHPVPPWHNMPCVKISSRDMSQGSMPASYASTVPREQIFRVNRHSPCRLCHI